MRLSVLASLPKSLSLFLLVSISPLFSMTPGAQLRLTSKGNVSLAATLHCSDLHAIVLIIVCCACVSA